jgi:hypothetical protein
MTAIPCALPHSGPWAETAKNARENSEIECMKGKGQTLIISTQLGWEGVDLDALFLATGLVEADFFVAADIVDNCGGGRSILNVD